jgi:hypothetical protein
MRRIMNPKTARYAAELRTSVLVELSDRMSATVAKPATRINIAQTTIPTARNLDLYTFVSLVVDSGSSRDTHMQLSSHSHGS